LDWQQKVAALGIDKILLVFVEVSVDQSLQEIFFLLGQWRRVMIDGGSFNDLFILGPDIVERL
jgi:hypothetical protein